MSGCCQAQRDIIPCNNPYKESEKTKGKSKVIWSNGFEMHDYSY